MKLGAQAPVAALLCCAFLRSAISAATLSFKDVVVRDVVGGACPPERDMARTDSAPVEETGDPCDWLTAACSPPTVTEADGRMSLMGGLDSRASLFREYGAENVENLELSDRAELGGLECGSSEGYRSASSPASDPPYTANS